MQRDGLLMQRFTLLLAAVAAVLPTSALASSAAAARWTLTDALSVPSMSDVRISPDGTRILYDVVRVTPQAVSDLYHLVGADGSPGPVFAADLAHPRWAPDSQHIAWIASDAKGATRIVVTGPRGLHRRVLTQGKRAIVGFSWSPGGHRIAAIETGTPAKVSRMRWISLRNDYRDTLPLQRTVWLVDVASAREKQLIHDGWSYGGPATDHDPHWSANGRKIALVRQPSPVYADFDRAQYVSIDTRSGAVAQLTHRGFFAYPQSASPKFANTGSAVAYVHTWDGKLPSREDLYVDGRDVTAKLDRDVWSCTGGQFAWTRDGLVADVMDGVSMRLIDVPARAAAPHALTPLGGSAAAFSVARTGRIAYIWSTPMHPAELYVLDPGVAPRQITHSGTIPARLPLFQTRYVTWSDGHGRVLHGQLTVPAGDLHHVPLLVEPHGGPQCANDASFDPPAQWLASNGYAYFLPDPAGSDGYGDWSYKAIIRNWGARPMADDMAGIDAVLKSGVGSPRRLFIEGGSYGGYLTTWMVTHTDRFKAAVAQAPVTNLLLDYTLGVSPNITQRFFGLHPTAHAALLAAQSPQTYVSRMHTPLLLMIGLKDTRAPYVQVIEFYKMLAERGAPVRLLADAQAGHGPSDPRGYMLWWRATMAWLAAHGGPHVPGATLPPGAPAGTAAIPPPR